MILGVDIGNTHIVIGIIDNKGNVTDHVRMRTDRFRTSYEYAADIRQVLALKKIYAGNIDGSIISSVVPQVTLTVRSALKFLSGKEPKVLGNGLKTGLELDMNGRIRRRRHPPGTGNGARRARKGNVAASGR